MEAGRAGKREEVGGGGGQTSSQWMDRDCHWEVRLLVRLGGEGWLGVWPLAPPGLVCGIPGMGTGVWLFLTLQVPRFRTSPSPWRSLSCGRTVTSSTCEAWRPSCGAWMRGSGRPTGPFRPRASRWVLLGSGQRSREALGSVPISSQSGGHIWEGPSVGWPRSRVQCGLNAKGQVCIRDKG